MGDQLLLVGRLDEHRWHWELQADENSHYDGDDNEKSIYGKIYNIRIIVMIIIIVTRIIIETKRKSSEK